MVEMFVADSQEEATPQGSNLTVIFCITELFSDSIPPLISKQANPYNALKFTN